MDMFDVLSSVLFLCFCSESLRKVLRVCLCYRKDVLDQCPIELDEILQVFDVEIPKPKEQVEQEQDVDRINEKFKIQCNTEGLQIDNAGINTRIQSRRNKTNDFYMKTCMTLALQLASSTSCALFWMKWSWVGI